MASILQRGTGIARDKQGGVSCTETFICDTLAETLTCGEGVLNGLPEESRAGRQQTGGAGRYEVTINYKGADGTGALASGGGSGGGGASSNVGLEKARWSGRIVIREEPLLSMPGIEDLIDVYEGCISADKKSIDWNEWLEKDAAGGFRPAKGRIKNPMFGLKTYPSQEGEVSCSYIHKGEELPVSLFENTGEVVKKLPTKRIATPKGYVWITLPPEFEDFGQKAWKIKQTYRLTHAGGFAAIIQKFIKK